MEITERYRTWIHTHFVTDCVCLPTLRMREIRRGIAPALRRRGIVFGIHFESGAEEKTIRIVLECIPLPEDLRIIESELRALIRKIPARPVSAQVIHVEEPRRRGKNEEDPLQGAT